MQLPPDGGAADGSGIQGDTTRALLLRREVLTELGDDELMAVVGADLLTISGCSASHRIIGCFERCPAPSLLC